MVYVVLRTVGSTLLPFTREGDCFVNPPPAGITAVPLGYSGKRLPNISTTHQIFEEYFSVRNALYLSIFEIISPGSCKNTILWLQFGIAFARSGCGT